MATKIQELTNPKSCFNKAAPKEPMFVLLGRDPHAAATIRLWATMSSESQPEGKRNEALAVAEQFDKWSKLKNPNPEAGATPATPKPRSRRPRTHPEAQAPETPPATAAEKASGNSL